MVLDTFLILSWTTQRFVTQKLGLFKMSSILRNIHPDCFSSNSCLHYLCHDVPTDNAGPHPPCALLHSISKACGHQETWDMGLCRAAQETNMNTLRLWYSCLEHSTCTSHIYIYHTELHESQILTCHGSFFRWWQQNGQSKLVGCGDVGKGFKLF